MLLTQTQDFSLLFTSLFIVKPNLNKKQSPNQQIELLSGQGTEMSTFNKICLWTSIEGIITENRSSETKSTPAVITMCLNVWSGRGHTSVSHLVWTSVVVGPSSYDKELASTAGHSRRADCLFHWRHLCPTVGEGVVTLHAAQAALPIIATNSIDLRADTHRTD